MGILALLVFVVLVVLAIIISVQESSIKKLNRQNKEQAAVIAANKKREDTELEQLSNYLSQNPLEVYQLLESHVETARSRSKNNR